MIHEPGIMLDGNDVGNFTPLGRASNSTRPIARRDHLRKIRSHGWDCFPRFVNIRPPRGQVRMWERPGFPRRVYCVWLCDTSARLPSAGVRMVMEEEAGSYQNLVLNSWASSGRRQISVPFVSSHYRTSSQGEYPADSSICVVKSVKFKKSIVGFVVARVSELYLVVGRETTMQGRSISGIAQITEEDSSTDLRSGSS